MDDIYRSQFRLPYSLYESLKMSASSNRRSINAELVARLEETFGAQGMDSGHIQHADSQRGKAGQHLENLVSSFVAQIEQEVQRQAEELAVKLAEERAGKESPAP
ncbi:MAG: Arc family DNA-binding protein [Pseudomonas fluorescens]